MLKTFCDLCKREIVKVDERLNTHVDEYGILLDYCKKCSKKADRISKKYLLKQKKLAIERNNELKSIPTKRRFCKIRW